jgi:FkbM family methyltransferase
LSDFNSGEQKVLLKEIRSEYTIPFLLRPRRFKKFLKKEFVALDLGGNVGGFSIVFSKNFSRIFSVEPSSRNVQLSNDAFNYLGIQKTTILNRALASDDEREILLHRILDANGNYRNSDFTTTDYVSKESIREIEEKVRSISIAGVMALIGTRIDFCKCDVEGAEYEGFLGQDLSQINFLVMELHYDALGQIKTRELINHLEKYFDYYRSYDKNRFESWPPPQILRMINKSNKNKIIKLGSRISHRIIVKCVGLWTLPTIKDT